MSPWQDSRIADGRSRARSMACSRLRPGRLTSGKSGNWRRHVGGVPFANAGQRRVRQRTVQIGPDPGLVAQILRLAVAAVEPGEDAEQLCVSLGGHDRIKPGEAGRIET